MAEKLENSKITEFYGYLVENCTASDSFSSSNIWARFYFIKRNKTTNGWESFEKQ